MTMMAVQIRKLIFITILSNIFQFCQTQTFLLSLFRDNELEIVVKDFLRSAPHLKDVISQLEDSDFLNQYKSGESNEDKNLNATQLAAKYGYKLQLYQVQTEDGYIPSVYRIPGNGEPVLLVHGIFNSAVDWFTIGRDNALPCALADQGYDVWMLNMRGFTHDSRGHVSLSAEEDPDQYWDFSWDECGRYDLPATIDLIIETTGKPKLKYVGHSMGTTAFFVMGSERPEYLNKVSFMTALSPIAWMSHIISPIIRILANLKNFFKVIRYGIDFNVIKQSDPLIQLVTKGLCGNTEVANLLCGNLVFVVTGFNYEQVNATQMPVIFGHVPSATSTKMLIHYAQNVLSGKFNRYDYNSIKNIEEYGTSEPPEYTVDNISTPVALFYRKESDWLSADEDVLILKNRLPNVVDFYEVPQENWSHTDYIWAKDVKHFVYDRVLELLKRY